MPTYEYECTVCGHAFEQFQSITAPPVKQCPVCRKKVRRLIGGGSALLFKGSGFYITDYRSKNYQEKSSQEKKDQEAKIDAKPESKTEVKTETKNKPKPTK